MSAAHADDTAEARGWAPGQVLGPDGTIELNVGRPRTSLRVTNTGDRPVQVGSHYHFAEVNPALDFDRAAAHGQRLDVAAGTSVRFEPGIAQTVALVPYGGARIAAGFRGEVAGPLDAPLDGPATGAGTEGSDRG